LVIYIFKMNYFSLNLKVDFKFIRMEGNFAS